MLFSCLAAYKKVKNDPFRGLMTMDRDFCTTNSFVVFKTLKCKNVNQFFDDEIVQKCFY